MYHACFLHKNKIEKKKRPVCKQDIFKIRTDKNFYSKPFPQSLWIKGYTVIWWPQKGCIFWIRTMRLFSLLFLYVSCLLRKDGIVCILGISKTHFPLWKNIFILLFIRKINTLGTVFINNKKNSRNIIYVIIWHFIKVFEKKICKRRNIFLLF